MSKRGETIRINFFGGLEDTARYSNNLEEALANGLEVVGRGNPAPTCRISEPIDKGATQIRYANDFDAHQSRAVSIVLI